jgi:hypothetical protein
LNEVFFKNVIIALALMMTAQTTSRIHVIKRNSRWAVKKQGNARASRVFDTKEEAVKSAKRYKAQGYDLIVHHKDGSVEQWEVAEPAPRYGNQK